MFRVRSLGSRPSSEVLPIPSLPASGLSAPVLAHLICSRSLFLLNSRSLPLSPSLTHSVSLCRSHSVSLSLCVALTLSLSLSLSLFSFSLALSYPVVPRRDSDQFLVVCCDGVFDVLSNEQVRDWLRDYTRKGGSTPLLAASGLVESALDCGSSDNISAVVLYLPGAPLPAP